jgi:2,3-bisphosphoglycerate-dependent phosphoglycerate mutase
VAVVGPLIHSAPASSPQAGVSARSAALSPEAGAKDHKRSIFLIRHGETLGNASRTVQLPDNPLSPRGIAQAERLARRLEREGITSILSSDLARAVTTADHLRRITGAPVRHDPLLQERNFGDLRGTPYVELRFDMFAPRYAPPNGESWEVFHARVDRAWVLVQQAAAAAHGNLAVVTHGLVCRALAARHLILPLGQEAPERWENTALTIVDYPAPWRVRLLNSIAHLDGLDTAPPSESGAA